MAERTSRKRPCENRKTVEEKNIAEQLYAILDKYTIHPLFEEWALEAMKEVNADEAKEREAIENSQFKNLQQLRQQHDKLIDLAGKELIREDKFKEKSQELLEQIKNAENAVSETNVRAVNWRDALQKTIDTIAHGRARFQGGDMPQSEMCY